MKTTAEKIAAMQEFDRAEVQRLRAENLRLDRANDNLLNQLSMAQDKVNSLASESESLRAELVKVRELAEIWFKGSETLKKKLEDISRIAGGSA